jgi:hypothetical protein
MPSCTDDYHRGLCLSDVVNGIVMTKEVHRRCPFKGAELIRPVERSGDVGKKHRGKDPRVRLRE